MSSEPTGSRDLAERVRAALEAADLDAMRTLLSPGATWGPPDDPESGCHNRDEVLDWYRRAGANGARADVVEVVAGPGTLLVGLRVTGTAAAAEQGGIIDRWQVKTLRDGMIADIRGFEARDEAVRRAGLA
jgi:hypothetical protein